MAPKSSQKEDITKQKASELIEFTEVSESECEEKCKEKTINVNISAVWVNKTLELTHQKKKATA